MYGGPRYVRAFATLLSWKDGRRYSISVQYDEVVGRYSAGVKVKDGKEVEVGDVGKTAGEREKKKHLATTPATHKKKGSLTLIVQCVLSALLGRS